MAQLSKQKSASIIIPTFNGSKRIGRCLEALLSQTAEQNVEIIVVNDGSTDNTSDVVSRYSGIRLISQANAGPAAARNRGAQEAKGEILLFTDDDCVPTPDWLCAMLAPFEDAQVVGAKGVYRTHQKRMAARFVQIEYEDRYHLMAGLDSIDFVDTYSAAFRRERFMEMSGYDTSFLVAAEDIDLSYRMSARGWKMKFIPSAIVYHTHPDTFWSYLKKKYKFAFWRMLAVRKNPGKGIKDSHTPQIMKLQLLFVPALVFAIGMDIVARPSISISLLAVVAFLLSTLPFTWRALRRDVAVGLLAPVVLAGRSVAQLLGVARGLIYARSRPVKAPAGSSQIT